jgi:hypothetical protein
MDRVTAKTSGSYSTFVSMCDSLERRLVSTVGADGRFERLRLLRHAFATWPDSPPSSSERSEKWLELLALEKDVADAEAADRCPVDPARPRVA